jgi:hypothetical protein
VWFEDLPPGRSWTYLIGAYVSCEWGGIRTVDSPCPACASPPYELTPKVITIDGRQEEICATFQGAEGRPEDYQLLALMEREWRRPKISYRDAGWLTGAGATSERMSIAILFWTYFESRMNRLVKLGLAPLPSAVQRDLLKRYDSVSTHMNELYAILFDTKYIDDLEAIGAESVGGHLARVKDARNRFVHGDPTKLSDSLIEAIVRNLKSEHDAWVAVFNRRISIQRRSPR